MISYLVAACWIAFLFIAKRRIDKVFDYQRDLLHAVSRDLRLRIYTTGIPDDEIDKMFNALDVPSLVWMMFSPKPFRDHYKGSILESRGVLDDVGAR